MHFLPLLIVFAVVVGLSCFALDFYRNRQRLSQPANPSLDMDLSAADVLLVDGDDLKTLETVANQVEHSVGASLEHLLNGLSHH